MGVVWGIAHLGNDQCIPFAYSAHPRTPRLRMTCLVFSAMPRPPSFAPAAAAAFVVAVMAARLSGLTEPTTAERRMYQNVVTVTMAFFVAFVFGSPLLSVVLALIMPLLIFAGYIQVCTCSTRVGVWCACFACL